MRHAKPSSLGDMPEDIVLWSVEMGTYFKPWRRKLGVMVLLFTCLFAAGWIRSLAYVDQIGIRLAHQYPGAVLFGIQSFRGHFHFCPSPAGWSAIPITAIPRAVQDRVPVGEFSYWKIVLPLTVLSTWLLLYRPPLTVDADELMADNSTDGCTKRMGPEQIECHLNNIHSSWQSSAEANELPSL
jgi:hypothetical protein